MKIFITGSTGYIGTHLVERLLQTNHELYCFARKTSQFQGLQATRAKIIMGDINDKESLVKGMQGCDWLVHLASSFELWLTDKHVYHEVNVDGLRNVMTSALETDIRKIVHISSAAVYGNASWPISEKSQFGSYRLSHYAQTKFEGDKIAWQLYEEKGLPLVVMYPSAVLGANDPKASGRYLKNFALGRMPAQVLANITFSFVHVKDVCEAIMLALEKEDNIGEKYLVGACNMTFGELNQLICEAAGTNLPFLHLPTTLTMMGAYLMTGIANLLKKPPLLDMSVDQVRTMKQGLQVDGGKTAKELGLVYTPIRKAVTEAVASFRK
ncbi:MAG: NAD-dependent epimerase/dehydratase family protein [Anaerolineales bacterium]